MILKKRKEKKDVVDKERRVSGKVNDVKQEVEEEKQRKKTVKDILEDQIESAFEDEYEDFIRMDNGYMERLETYIENMTGYEYWDQSDYFEYYGYQEILKVPKKGLAVLETMQKEFLYQYALSCGEFFF